MNPMFQIAILIVLLLIDAITDVREWSVRGEVSSLNKWLSGLVRVIVFFAVAAIAIPISTDMPHVLVAELSWLRLSYTLLISACYWIVFDLLINFLKGFKWNYIGGTALTDKLFGGKWYLQYLIKIVYLAVTIYWYNALAT